MDGRPHVHGGISVKTESGEKGFRFEESPEEQAINRWKVGQFTEAEHILANRWRESTREFDFEAIKQKLRQILIQSNFIKDFEGLNIILDSVLLQKEIQKEWLFGLVSEFQLNIEIAQRTFLRWEQGNFSFIKEFAPYAFYCFKVNMFFYLGLLQNLIGTKPTNRLDLEYLYYLPFCMVFSSNDKFHKNISPFFLRPDQLFVEGAALKKDITLLTQEWNALDENARKERKSRYGSTPHENENSITFQLWQKLMNRSLLDYGDRESNLNEEQKAKLLEKLNRFMEASEDLDSSRLKSFEDSEIDFMLRKRTISVEDPCPCGSGKKFKDCHGREIS